MEQDDQLILEVAKHHLRTFHFIGLVERWNDSIELLKYSLGWAEESKFANVESEHVGKYEMPSSEITELIAQYNDLGIQLYEYAKALWGKRWEKYQHATKQYTGDRNPFGTKWIKKIETA
jgi:hypothetical protein